MKIGAPDGVPIGSGLAYEFLQAALDNRQVGQQRFGIMAPAHANRKPGRLVDKRLRAHNDQHGARPEARPGGDDQLGERADADLGGQGAPEMLFPKRADQDRGGADQNREQGRGEPKAPIVAELPGRQQRHQGDAAGQQGGFVPRQNYEAGKQQSQGDGTRPCQGKFASRHPCADHHEEINRVKREIIGEEKWRPASIAAKQAVQDKGAGGGGGDADDDGPPPPGPVPGGHHGGGQDGGIEEGKRAESMFGRSQNR